MFAAIERCRHDHGWSKSAASIEVGYTGAVAALPHLEAAARAAGVEPRDVRAVVDSLSPDQWRALANGPDQALFDVLSTRLGEKGITITSPPVAKAVPWLILVLAAIDTATADFANA